MVLIYLNVQSRKSEISLGRLVRDLNPRPRAPEARIIPINQRAVTC